MTTSRAARDVLALLVVLTGAASAPLHGTIVPTTPIRHLIVIVGETRSFDNLYGGYRPTPGQSVMNLRHGAFFISDRPLHPAHAGISLIYPENAEN
jgi:phospholipase C